MRLRQNGLGREDGTTLVEVVIASALSIMLLLAVLATLDTGTRSEKATQARQDALADLRSTLTKISKEVRQATYVAPGCPASPRCSSATQVDMDTLIAGATHRVVYRIIGGTVTRALDGGTAQVLTDRITGASTFCFNYPDCPWRSPALDPVSVRVSLSLTPVAFGTGAITLATDVELRNL